MVEGIKLNKKAELDFCEVCVHGKQHRTPLPTNSMMHAQNVLEIIHSDICGPMSVNSFSNARYFVTFINDKTQKTFAYFLRRKDEVFEKFKLFKAAVENETGKRIKILRTDNGSEYTSKHFEKYLKNRGIQHQKTVPYTPEQNGITECANRTIVERVRTMLHEQHLDPEFWAEAILTSVYLKNRSLTKALPEETPEQAWSGKRPSVTHL